MYPRSGGFLLSFETDFFSTKYGEINPCGQVERHWSPEPKIAGSNPAKGKGKLLHCRKKINSNVSMAISNRFGVAA